MSVTYEIVMAPDVLLFSLSCLDSPIWPRHPLWDSLITHSDTPKCMGPLWRSDQPVAETSTYQHTTLTTIKYPCYRRDSYPQSQQASGRSPTRYTARPPGSTCVTFCPVILVYAEHFKKRTFISFLLAGNQLDAQFFYIIRLFQSSTCFEQTHAHDQEVNCINL